MVNNNPYSTNISFLISNQIPEHIRSDNELYNEFMTAYYEWLELVNNPLYMSEHLSDFNDIDRTPEYFFNYLKNEILANFPQNVLADKTLLIRFAKDFYERKGTLSSYKFLFKALYNDDIEISLPKNSILRASDGKWVVDNYILCYSISGDPFNLVGDYLYTIDNRKLFVDNIILQNQGKYNVFKIFVPTSNISLDVDESLYNKDKSIVVKTYGVLKDVEIISSGNNYKVGDYITINDPYGVDGVIRVKSLKPSNNINAFKIINGGDNYRVGDKLTFESTNGGIGADAYVSKINVNSISNQCITTIETEQNILTDDIKNTKVEDYIKYQNFEIGSIKEIALVDGGRDYLTMPNVSIYQKPLYNLPEGKNAQIEALSKNTGQIIEAEIINRGVGYKKSEIYPILDLTNIGDGTAKAKASVYAGVIHSNGYWKDNSGKLDSTIFLQDNYYYQNFSYVIKSSQSINSYKDIISNSIHLSGSQMFGEVNVNELVKIFRQPYYSPTQFIQITYDQFINEHVKQNQLVSININNVKTYADMYGGIYYIKDFANYSPSLFADLPLENFVAIYQDLLLGNILDNKLNVISNTKLSELYGSTRNAPGHANSAEVIITKK